jgi:hypothetical protein
MRKRLTIALVALGAVLLTVSGRAESVSQIQFQSRYVWNEEFDGFGGLSAIEVAANGRDFLALTDRMTLIEGTLLRSGGRITGVSVQRHKRLQRPKGVTLKHWKRDSEGLAQQADGAFYVSLERLNQVWRYPRAFGAPTVMSSHPDFHRFAQNAGIEALAIDRRNRVYAVPEEVPENHSQLPLYRLSAEGWQILNYIEANYGFSPVGADFGPDGFFYLLERRFSGIGFRSRIRRFDLNAFDPAGEVLLSTGIGTHDNLEGLSVWRDDAGLIRATMIADDNFKFFQTSEIVEYVITPRAAAAHR